MLAEQTLAVPQDEAAALALARGVLSLGARAPAVDRGARSNGATGSCFCAGPRARRGPTCRTKRSPPIPDGWRRSSTGKTRLDEIGADDLADALGARLPWALARRLDDEAPTHFRAPTGTAAPIDYEAEGGPAIALRVQELFGLKDHPSLAGGRIPLTLELLSPAHRPIQITRDLPGFWRGSWAAVRADLRGRYPRHFWPEDPGAAAPTARAKPRGT